MRDYRASGLVQVYEAAFLVWLLDEHIPKCRTTGVRFGLIGAFRNAYLNGGPKPLF